MRALGFLFLVVLFLSSCSEKTQLTGSLMTLIKENQLPLEKIQFYNDNPLFLERELNASEANVKSGKVLIVNGKSINRITLEKQTPGLLVKQSQDHLLISLYSIFSEARSLQYAESDDNISKISGNNKL